MRTKDSRNDFVVQGGILAIAGLITRLIGLLYRVPLTRIIGSEGMGYYNTAYELYYMTLLISTYSLPVALSKLIASHDTKKEYANSYQLFRVAMCMSACIGTIFSVLLFIFADKLAAFIKWPSATIPLRFLAPTIFIFSVMGIIRGFFQGKRTMVPTALSQVVEQIFNAIVSIVAAVLLMKSYKDTAQAAVYGAAGGTLGTFAGAVFGLLFLAFIYYINHSYFRKKAVNDRFGVTETNLRFAKIILFTMLPIILSQTVYQISGLIDNAMFGTIMDGKGVIESEKAILWEAYSNKYKWLSNLPVAISSAFGVSIVPLLSANYTDGKIETVKEKIASSIKLNMLIAIPSAFGLFFLAKPILVLIFNDVGDALSPDLMRLGAVAIIFFSLSTFTNGVLQGINRLKVPVINSAVSLGVHVAIVFVLIYVFDFSTYGLVIGNVSYAMLVCILNWLAIGKYLDYKQELKTTFIIPAVASLIMGIIAFFVYKLLYLVIPSNTFAVIPAIIIAVFVYFALLLLLKGVSRSELSDMPKGNTLVRIAERLHLLRD